MSKCHTKILIRKHKNEFMPIKENQSIQHERFYCTGDRKAPSAAKHDERNGESQYCTITSISVKFRKSKSVMKANARMIENLKNVKSQLMAWLVQRKKGTS